jgi:GNAT superfamily N-acetyltransferase
MQTIGRAAGERFREIGDERVARCADDPPMTLDELGAYQASGRALIAVEGSDVVGFAVFDVIDGRAHLEEVSVDPSATGRGHGSALVAAVWAWAVGQGLDGVTLTTFAEVPWNRPFYERRGFRVLAEGELTAGVRARREEEAALGLVPELRVVMWRGR